MQTPIKWELWHISWWFFNNTLVEEVLERAQWKCRSTFIGHYLWDVSAQVEGVSALGPVVVAQRVHRRLQCWVNKWLLSKWFFILTHMDTDAPGENDWPLSARLLEFSDEWQPKTMCSHAQRTLVQSSWCDSAMTYLSYVCLDPWITSIEYWIQITGTMYWTSILHFAKE